ncbi:hypothetical protein PMM47T1_08376 [Pseudomonas sp. M47T1]|uniref:hypothetical protein n=1 Tax=Pseudomonas sp. M47T1 TaxID=1179778 RepID=UPI0002607AEE|nr:hypothetical protein [Pseudomonas sp. M47T1]EIK97143.1 hypothetical protein PMM47T1_08376 [Pseudomonas sp. M47T1]
MSTTHDLHEWWVTRHTRKILQPSDQIAAQQRAMIEWLDFLKRVMDGYGIPDLKKGSGIGMGAATRWRQQFLLLIESQGHTERLQWITWMRKRRNIEIQQYVREGGVVEKSDALRVPAKSAYRRQNHKKENNGWSLAVRQNE